MPISRRTLLSVGGLVVAGGAVGVWRYMNEPPPGSKLPAAITAAPPTPTGDPRMAERGLGRADAKVVVTEWFSMTCPHRAAFHRDSLPRIKSELIDTGKMRLVFRDFPLDQAALTAAMVSRALPAERYEPFVAALLASQDRWAFNRQANPTENRLSNESPVGRAIIGHKKGETVEVLTPRGSKIKFKIMEIKAA